MSDKRPYSMSVQIVDFVFEIENILDLLRFKAFPLVYKKRK